MADKITPWIARVHTHSTSYENQSAMQSEIADLRALIASMEAQPEQKPVAWMYRVNNAHTNFLLCEPPDDVYDEGTLVPLYAAPQAKAEPVQEPHPPHRQCGCDDCKPSFEAELA